MDSNDPSAFASPMLKLQAYSHAWLFTWALGIQTQSYHAWPMSHGPNSPGCYFSFLSSTHICRPPFLWNLSLLLYFLFCIANLTLPSAYVCKVLSWMAVLNGNFAGWPWTCKTTWWKLKSQYLLRSSQFQLGHKELLSCKQPEVIKERGQRCWKGCIKSRVNRNE